LVVYGARQAHRDFDRLPQLIKELQSVGVLFDAGALAQPDPVASSILLSKSVNMSEEAISRLRLDV
jgi:hypothetical protein